MHSKNTQPSIEDVLATIRTMATQGGGDWNSAPPSHDMSAEAGVDRDDQFVLPEVFRTEESRRRDTLAERLENDPAVPTASADDRDERAGRASEERPEDRWAEHFNSLNNEIRSDDGSAMSIGQAATPRTMPPMRDTHFDKLADSIRMAWPGLNPGNSLDGGNTVEDDCRGGCFGPIVTTNPSLSAHSPDRRLGSGDLPVVGDVGLPDVRPQFSRPRETEVDRDGRLAGYGGGAPGVVAAPILPELQPELAATPNVVVPPLPQSSNASASAVFEEGAVENATAELLRPMLKQWLDSHMPVIVEQALLSEVKDNESTH